MLQPIPTQKLPIEKEEVGFWQAEIKASEDFQRSQFINRLGYEKVLQYYEGLQHNEIQNPHQMAIIDEIYPGISSIISGTYYQNPTVTVKAKHPSAEEPVQLPFEAQLQMMARGEDPTAFPQVPLNELMQGALKYGIEKNDLKAEAKLALFDLLAAGYCVIEANHITEQAQPFVGQEAPEDARNITDKAADGIINGAKSLFNKLTGRENGENSTQETRSEVEERIAAEVDTEGKDYIFDSTYIERWNPLDILFDYRATTFKKSRYVVKKVRMTRAEFKDKYPDFKDKIPTSTDDTQTMVDFTQGHVKEDNKREILVYEIQIRNKQGGVRVLNLTCGIPEALDHYELPFRTNDFTLKYGCIDKYGRLYPVSKIRRAIKPQDDLNHYITIQMEHADRALRKVAVWEGGLTDDGKQALKSGDPYAVINKKNPGPVFEALPVGGVAPENKDLQLQMVEAINKNIGSNELAKSGDSDARFATQDAIQNQAFGANTNHIRDALGDVIREVLNTYKDIIQQLWDGDDFFKVTGLEGGDFWYRPELGRLSDILEGDYLVEADITTAERPNPMKQRMDNTELANFLLLPVVQQFLASQGKMVDVSVITETIKSYNKNPDLILRDLPQPEPVPEIDPLTGQPVGAVPAEGQVPQPVEGTNEVPLEPVTEGPAGAVPIGGGI
jgi:hypothetical protein